jgi:hypothetical protein
MGRYIALSRGNLLVGCGKLLMASLGTTRCGFDDWFLQPFGPIQAVERLGSQIPILSLPKPDHEDKKSDFVTTSSGRPAGLCRQSGEIPERFRHCEL